ncbi:MAG: glycosyltransferase family 4 protein [candidate division WWE3 bacterium]|nr:glycosyltransferase family 4 protein [candidate division WWE3 bacterium]
MRIAIFIKNTIYHGKYGGLETQNENLVQGLREAGHDVIVFAPASELSVSGYIFVPRTTPGKYDEAWWQKSLAAFESLHAVKPFDIVISQSAAGAEIIKNKERLHVKTIVVAHGTIWGEVKTVLRKTKSFKDIYFAFKAVAFGLKTYSGLDRKYLLSADHIIAVSQAVKKALTQEFPLRNDHITVISNGIDIYKYIIADETKVPVNFLYLGRLEKEKGLELLLMAFKNVLEKEPTATLTIVGSGPFKLQASDSITILGAVDYKDVPRILASASVFVLPTLRHEGLPMTLVEAAASGLPLVASDMGGIKEIVRDGVNGFLLKSGDASVLSETLVKLAKDPELRHTLGQASRQIAEAEFSLEIMIINYIKVIKFICGS